MNIEHSKVKIAVLMGGIGPERQISFQSGKCIAESLSKAGLDVVTFDITPSNMEILDDSSIDVFFVALHGRFGEDGQLQKILEDKGLIYTGSGPAASELAFDKIASKKSFTEAGISVPKAIEYDGDTDIRQLEEQLKRWPDKYVVKPIKQGSSVGVSIVTGTETAVNQAQQLLDEFGDCMIEEFIPGREITVGILGNEPLPIIEIRPAEGFYNYHAKYIDEKTEFLFDTIEDSDLQEDIKHTAINCFQSLGCQGFARVDFILSEQGRIYALEVNTIPGFTSHSLLPKAALKAGISMSELCVNIITEVLESNKLKTIH